MSIEETSPVRYRVVTPEALQRALKEHGAVGRACAAIGITRQGVHQRPAMKAVLDAWQAARGRGEPSFGRSVVVSEAASANVERLARALAASNGCERPRYTDAVRKLLREALGGVLPAAMPAPAEGVRVKARCDDLWGAVANRRADAEGTIRAVLEAAAKVAS